MKKTFLLCILYILGLGLCTGQNQVVVTPAGEMPRAVSGHFAGMANGKLHTWGGCNFPDIPCADGGQKVYYPKAYGASVTVPEGTVYIGGKSLTPALGKGEGEREVSNSEVTFHPSLGGDGRDCPPLPKGLDNFAACYGAGKIFVAGGQTDGVPNREVYALDWPDGKEWYSLTPLPGGLCGPLAALHGGTECAGGEGFVYIWRVQPHP